MRKVIGDLFTVTQIRELLVFGWPEASLAESGWAGERARKNYAIGS